MRLDRYLVEHEGLFSRNKAQELIKASKVKVGGRVVTKPSYVVQDESVELEHSSLYVSRSAMKLKGFLEGLPFSPKGLEALDIGASTGGFTQVLLENGAAHVIAVDVGTAQLHETLRAHPRVDSAEKTDIRRYDPQRRFELVVSDVSFISLLNILDDIERLASKWIILLFKPQFEVGNDAKRDRNGVVKDEKAIGRAMGRFEDACALLHWTMVAKTASILSGKEGNIEYCYCYRKD